MIKHKKANRRKTVKSDSNQASIQSIFYLHSTHKFVKAGNMENRTETQQGNAV